MAFRGFVIVVYIAALLIEVVSVMLIPQNVWQLMRLGQTLAARASKKVNSLANHNASSKITIYYENPMASPNFFFHAS